MKRTTHPAAQALDPSADKPKLMIDYSGIQVLDARDRIQVVLTGKPPRGVKAGLRIEGFKPISENTWEAPHTPMAIYGAQAIVKIFFEEEFNG